MFGKVHYPHLSDNVDSLAGMPSFPRAGVGISAVPPLNRAPKRLPDRQGREFLLNHIWESLNCGAKILFFAIATPLMLSAWGAERFGLFAVANSCIGVMAIIDLGLRTSTRVGLANPELLEKERIRLHVLHVAAFSIASAGTISIVAVLSLAGYWHRWLQLPPTGDLIVVMATTFTAATMWLQLLLERIAAAGRLSRIKVALCLGNLLAFVLVIAALKAEASVATVTAAYFAAMAFPLLLLLPHADLHPRLFVHALAQFRPCQILDALHVGRWINVITASWVFQSYGLVFLISWVLGPAAAGTFFLYLKLSELLSVLGASTSEPTIAALAGASSAFDRRRHFATGYRSTIALCLTGALGYIFFSGDLFRIWLHRPLDNTSTGFLIGIFGVAAGFSRMVSASSVGLAKPRPAALGLLAGAVTIAAYIIAVRSRSSPESILAITAGAALFLLPATGIIARDFESTLVETWLWPVLKFTPQLFFLIAIWWTGARIHTVLSFAAAVAISALVCALHILRSAGHSHIDARDSILGYDTRSWRSALVMKAVDLIRPFRRAEKFKWAAPCVVSSTAGLGDLFIDLPLIAGIVNHCRENELKVIVALRPAHLEIGRRFGWDVVPFDSGLEDFFKNSAAFCVSNLLATVRAMRKSSLALWIDLTGSAVSAIVIRACGAKKLTARITRGGKSLTNHPLPHTIQENEYANRGRVADFLGCAIDSTVPQKMIVRQRPEFSDCVVLCITTASRWKNWPLANFRFLVERFRQTEFAVVGFKREVLAAEIDEFQRIVNQQNVIDYTDRLSVTDLVDMIAQSRAVITNDTSAAHIANFFGKPGAVLFGPVSPRTFAAPNGLRVFHDATCPYHPCVQWTCANQENWCMRKISTDSVAEYLDRVLAIHASTPLPQPPVERFSSLAKAT
jgi:ADP-heptose:LPS heptosyltransferase